MIAESIAVDRLKERLEFVHDPVLRNMPVVPGQNAEIRRSAYQIEGGGFMYMLTFTVMPEGQKRAETPRLKGFTEARAEA